MKISETETKKTTERSMKPTAGFFCFFFLNKINRQGFLNGSASKVSACNAGDGTLGWKDTLRRKWQPSPIFLPGESCGQRSLEDYGQLGHKKSEMTEATEHTKQKNFQLDSPRKKKQRIQNHK